MPQPDKGQAGIGFDLYGKQGVTEVPGNDRSQLDGLLKSLLSGVILYHVGVAVSLIPSSLHSRIFPGTP